MMRTAIHAALTTVLLLAGCSAGRPVQTDPTAEAAAGTILTMDGGSVNGLRVTRSGNTLSIAYAELDESGKFIRIPLDGSYAVASEEWEGDAGLLHLSVAYGNELHIGVLPQNNTVHQAPRVKIRLGPGTRRRISEVPDGDINKLVDLSAESQGDGTVLLNWSEVNRGDYDFNGETNISDITGLARSLEKSYDTADPGAPLLTEYWVDGNQDGTVSVADISVIGQNYGNQVAGYAVNRNGALLDPEASGFTVVRPDSQPRPGLPNAYDVSFAGSVTDSIVIVPKDSGGHSGVETDPPAPVPQFHVDVNLQLNLDNTGLYDLDGSGASGAFGPGRFAISFFDLIEMEPLRRLLPGELPESAELGTSLLSAQQAELYDLPLDRPLALGLIYLPTRNLATGLETDPPAGPVSNFWELNPLVNIYPLPMLATRETQNIGLTLSIDNTGGTKIVGISSLSGIDGPLSLPLAQEFDDHFLSRNTENDGFSFPGAFEDDVRLSDGQPGQASWGVSQHLLKRLSLAALLPESQRHDYTMTAKIELADNINPAQGFIRVRVEGMSVDGVPFSAPELPLEPVFVDFTELSEFLLEINAGGVTEHISPGNLLAGDILSISGELDSAAGEGGADQFWIDELLVHLR